MKKRATFIAYLALLLGACGNNVTINPQEGRTIAGQEVRVDEISFRSDNFKVVGDLLIPAEGERHPAVIMVHGSGDATRAGRVPFIPLIEIFLRNGYAVFAWDKPGSGESTGEFSDEITQRADILVDGIKVLTEHQSIDPDRIGLWGISQAGWVIPLAIEESENIAFMIVVSGGAEDSIEQMAYQIGQQVACGGGSVEQAALVELYWSQRAKAASYEKYREAVEVLLGIPGVKGYTGLEITEEKDWKPWSRDWDAFIDPMEVIKHTTIPMLVFFGELDKNIDPVQGAQAYEASLQTAGNQDYQIEVMPGVGHVLMPAETGCIGESGGQEYTPEYLGTLDAWLQHLSQ